jgi:hypothetical protein
MLKHEVWALEDKVKRLEESLEILRAICMTREYHITYKYMPGERDRQELIDEGYALALTLPAVNKYEKEVWVKRKDNHGRSKR